MNGGLSAQRPGPANPAQAQAFGPLRLRPATAAWPSTLRRHGLSALSLLLSLLLVASAGATAAAASAPAPAVDATSTSDSDAKLRQVMARAQSQRSGAASAPVGGSGYTSAIAPERLHERARLLQTGEAALARLEVDTAINAFDRAALIQHAADTEISLVRAYMQGGQYRRALASGAHTAGAHLDVVAGSALYAWLLAAGGQGVIGQRLLDEAQARLPNNAVVTGVQRQLRSGTLVATGALLGVPTRLAPYSRGPALPRRARVAGSAVLLADGRQALAPLALIPTGVAPPVWVRNGLGVLTAATVVARLPAVGMALLQLNTALPAADGLGVAAQEAFPGSAGFAVEYTANPRAEAAWPLLRTGFLGGMTGNPARPEERALGITMPPGPRGGPVFDVAGRLTGMALAPATGSARPVLPIFVSAPVLRRELARAAPAASLGTVATALPATPTAPAAVMGRVPVDVIYENALKTTLQLITLR